MSLNASQWQAWEDALTHQARLVPRRFGSDRCGWSSEHRGEYGFRWEAICSIAEKIGCSPETLRKWVRQTEVDSGRRGGVTSEEKARVKELGLSSESVQRHPPYAHFEAQDWRRVERILDRGEWIDQPDGRRLRFPLGHGGSADAWPAWRAAARRTEAVAGTPRRRRRSPTRGWPTRFCGRPSSFRTCCPSRRSSPSGACSPAGWIRRR